MADSNYGVVLLRNSVAVGEVVSLDPPELINESVETTNHASGGYREYVSGNLTELSEFTATINYLVATSGLTDALVAGTVDTYEIQFPNNASWEFEGLVVGFKPNTADAQSPEALEAEVKFRPTGTTTIS